VIIGIVVILIVLGIVAFFIIRWAINYFKEKNDIYLRIKKDRIKLSKTQARYSAKHWFKTSKNPQIRLVKRENGKLVVGKSIGNYRGDYTTHEGNVIISLNLEGHKKFYLYPETDVLVIPNKESVEIHVRDKLTNEIKTIIVDKIPLAKDMIQFNDFDILLFVESISRTSHFLVPVVKTKDGKIVDLSLPVFDSLREVALNDYLYLQTSMFAELAKKNADLNPYVRTGVKINESNQQIDIPREATTQQ
jgi:hypothetical protein